MEIMQKVFSIIEESGSAFVIGKYPENELIYHNKVAKDVYGICKETTIEEFYKMFEKSQLSLEVGIKTDFLDKGVVNFHDTLITKPNGQDQLADISIGFSNDTKKEVYLKITPKINTNIEMALYKIEQSNRPKSLFELSSDLKIFCCNKAFCDLINAPKASCLVQHSLKLTSLFKENEKDELITEIFGKLSKKEKFIKDVQIIKQTGDKHWVTLELEHIDIDKNQEKVMCTLTCINEFMKKEEEHTENEQFFLAMQRLSNDILYKIDVKTMTLHHSIVSDKLNLRGKTISNYVETLINEKLIHPDDANRYLSDIQKFIGGDTEMGLEPYRFALITDEYNWYKIRSEKKLDKDGNLIEVYGSLINVQKEEQLKLDLDELNDYFDIMQELSSDIVYKVDAKTMTLNHNIKSKHMLETVGNNFPNYVDVFIEKEIMHPDDVEKWAKFVENRHNGIIEEVPFRFALLSPKYEWYLVKDKRIYDKNGELKELWGTLINVTREQELKEEYNELNQYFDIVQEFSSDLVYKVEAKTMTLHHNIKTKRMLEKVGNDTPNYVDIFIEQEIIHPDDVEKWVKFVENRYNGIIEDASFRFALISDEYEWYVIKDKSIYDKNGELKEFWGTLINVTREQELKEEYNELNKYFDAMQGLSDESLYTVDIKTKQLRCKGIAKDELGLPELVEDYPKCVYELVYPTQLEEFKEFAHNSLTGNHSSVKIQIKNFDEKYQWYELISMIIKNEKDEPTDILGKIRNIENQVSMEQKATIDLMTQVLNKVSFEKEVENILSSSKDTEKHALIFIDLDDFKGVNDTLGHSFGDFLLTAVGKRLKRVIRDNDIVGRVGGDEFVVFLRDVEEYSVLQRAEILLETLRQEFVSNGKSRVIKASLGIAMYPNHGKDYKDLIQKSDMALYVSKRKGKNVATVFDDSMEEY